MTVNKLPFKKRNFFVYFAKKTLTSNIMAKRSGFQYRQPRSKMPKLDITISSSQTVTSRISVVAASSNAVNVHNNQYQNAATANLQPENPWEDDDEELILLASQAVDKYEANAEMVISQAMNNRIDLSYGRFRNEVRTSTQLDENLFNEFNNDEDDIFSNIPVDVCDNRPSTSTAAANQNKNIQNGFKVPENLPSIPRDDDSKRTEKAKNEVHQTFLTEKIKTQKKEIENLKETLNKITEKCQLKEGEVSIIVVNNGIYYF